MLKIIKNIGVNTEYCSDRNRIEEFNCKCNAGFEGRRCETDLCDDLTCQNGFCEAGSCICNAYFINIENICVETCDLNPCEVFIKITDFPPLVKLIGLWRYLEW